MTSAQRNMAIGGAVFLIGGVVTLVTYQAAKGGGTYVVAYGAIAIGAVQFLVGLFQFVGSRGQSAEGVDPATLAVHAMAYVASGDGRITEAERRTMELVLWRIADRPLPDRQTLELNDYARRPPDEDPPFRRAQSALSQADRQTVLKCAVLVALSDGEIAGAGAERLARVGLGLGLSLQDQQVVVHEVTKDLEQNNQTGQAAAPD